MQVIFRNIIILSILVAKISAYGQNEIPADSNRIIQDCITYAISDYSISDSIAFDSDQYLINSKVLVERGFKNTMFIRVRIVNKYWFKYRVVMGSLNEHQKDSIILKMNNEKREDFIRNRFSKLIQVLDQHKVDSVLNNSFKQNSTFNACEFIAVYLKDLGIYRLKGFRNNDFRDFFNLAINNNQFVDFREVNDCKTAKCRIQSLTVEGLDLNCLFKKFVLNKKVVCSECTSCFRRDLGLEISNDYR